LDSRAYRSKSTRQPAAANSSSMSLPRLPSLNAISSASARRPVWQQRDHVAAMAVVRLS
jgi:hypothetical protein